MLLRGLRVRTESDPCPFNWRLGAAHKGAVFFRRKNYGPPGSPPHLHRPVLSMGPVCQQHALVLSTGTPLDLTVGRRAEVAGRVPPLGSVEDEIMVARYTDMHVRVASPYP